MAEATTTYTYRLSLAQTLATNLEAGGQMAFGDGGHNAETLAALAPDATATALASERLRNGLVSVTVNADDYSVTATGRLAKAELVGVYVSEAGLIGSDGTLIGFRNFAPKIKESDELYDVEITIKF